MRKKKKILYIVCIMIYLLLFTLFILNIFYEFKVLYNINLIFLVISWFIGMPIFIIYRIFYLIKKNANNEIYAKERLYWKEILDFELNINEKYSKPFAILHKFLLFFMCMSIVVCMVGGCAYGNAEEMNGLYYVVEHGRLVREITTEEYAFGKLLKRELIICPFLIVMQMIIIKLKENKTRKE